MNFFLRIKNANNSITTSRIMSGKNNAGGTKTPAIVPIKANPNERANARNTEGKCPIT